MLQKHLKIAVTKDWDGLTIDNLLRNEWQLPKKWIHQMRMEKSVMINQLPVPMSTELKNGDILSVPLFAGPIKLIPASPISVPVLYEDEHLLAANKPASLKTHSNEENETGTMINALAYYLRQKEEPPCLKHIHRLDQDTSGAILFAKNDLAKAILDRLLAEGKINRVYTAYVHGKMKKISGTIEAPIGRDRHHPTRRRVSKSGQKAITHFEVLDYFPKDDVTKIECRLETGRTHQIRVHLSYIGHPLAGDILYGGKPFFHRQTLHACRIRFPHPISGESIEVAAPFPEDLSKFAKNLS